MIGPLLTLVPVGVALGLLVFGEYTNRPAVPFTPGAAAPGVVREGR